MTQEQQDYERLIAPIEDRMMRTVWRIVRDPADVEDAFQDALSTIWSRWRQVRRHPNPHALVLTICTNAAYDSLRRKARNSRWINPEALPDSIPAGTPSAPAAIESAQREAEVYRAVGRLSPNQARAILMHAVEDLSYEEIASTMNCRQSTVRKHVARARAHLRALLSHLLSPVQKEQSSHA